MARDMQYRVMLAKLDSLLRDEDLTRLKSFCKDYIPARVREEISQGVHLFEALEERNQLSQDNLTFLRDALSSCCGGRTDLMDLLADYQIKHEVFQSDNNKNAGSKNCIG